MAVIRTITLLLAIAAIYVLGATTARAQSPTSGSIMEPGPGRLACYVYATEKVRLESNKAVELCIGADSDTPARCADEALDYIGYSDLSLIELCRAARSTEPASCAARLDELGNEQNEVVAYCAALRSPIVAVATGGAPQCVQAGIDRTNLSEESVVVLCRGSTSSTPIDCFETGEDETMLADNDLIALCSPVATLAFTPEG
jgi:hypothetical protein